MGNFKINSNGPGDFGRYGFFSKFLQISEKIIFGCQLFRTLQTSNLILRNLFIQPWNQKNQAEIMRIVMKSDQKGKGMIKNYKYLQDLLHITKI